MVALQYAMQGRNVLLQSHWLSQDDGTNQFRRKKGQPDFAQEVVLEDISGRSPRFEVRVYETVDRVGVTHDRP